MSTELHSLLVDFPLGIDVPEIESEIISVLPTFIVTSIVDDVVNFVFSTILSPAERDTLANIVANYTPRVSVDPTTFLATSQLKKTPAVSPTATFANVVYDTTLFQNYTPFIEHNLINTDRIDIFETATYKLHYNATVDTGSVEFRVVKKDTTVIPGTEFLAKHTTANQGHISISCVAILTNGDYITLQVRSVDSGVILAGHTFLVHIHKGVKGDSGAIGAIGPTGPIGPQGPVGPSGPGTGDILSNGVSVDNAVARFHLGTGTVIQPSGIIIDDLDNITGVNNLSATELDVQNSTPELPDHLRFHVDDTFGLDKYNMNLDATITRRIMAESLNGVYRQAVLLGMDSGTGATTIFGISTSSDSGATWLPKFVVNHAGCVGICKNNPTEKLDVVGNIAATGTVNGRDIVADGVLLDSLSGGASISTKTTFVEDFFGSEIPWTWLCEIAGGNNAATMVDGSEGLIRLASEGNTNFTEINTKSKIVDVSKNQNLKVRLRLEQLADTRVEFGAYLNNSNLIRFVYDAAEPNWKSDTTLAGASTLSDSGVSADTAWHIFDIGMATGAVNFLVDGVGVGVHTTNISMSVKYLYVRTTSIAAANIQCTCDFVQLTGDR